MNKKWDEQKQLCEQKYVNFWRTMWRRSKKPVGIVLGVSVFLALSYYVALPWLVLNSSCHDTLFGVRGGLLTPQELQPELCDEAYEWNNRVDMRVAAIKMWVGEIVVGIVSVVVACIWLFLAAGIACVLPAIILVWLVCEAPIVFCTWWHLRKRK